jgi:hypothetical protein
MVYLRASDKFQETRDPAGFFTADMVAAILRLPKKIVESPGPHTTSIAY